MSGPGALRITAPYHDGPREVVAFPTPVPGLVISEDETDPGTWCVTHQRSGAALAYLPDPEHAVLIAGKLAGLADWTQSALVLRRSKKLVRAHARLLRDNDLTESYLGRRGVGNGYLRQVEAGAP